MKICVLTVELDNLKLKTRFRSVSQFRFNILPSEIYKLTIFTLRSALPLQQYLRDRKTSQLLSLFTLHSRFITFFMSFSALALSCLSSQPLFMLFSFECVYLNIQETSLLLFVHLSILIQQSLKTNYYILFFKHKF